MKPAIGSALVALLVLTSGSTLFGGRAKNPPPPPPLQFAMKMFHELEITEEDCPAPLLDEVAADPSRGLVCGSAVAGPVESFKTRWNRLAGIRVREFGFETTGLWKQESLDGSTFHVRHYHSPGGEWLFRVVVDDRASAVAVVWMGPPE